MTILGDIENNIMLSHNNILIMNVKNAEPNTSCGS